VCALPRAPRAPADLRLGRFAVLQRRPPRCIPQGQPAGIADRAIPAMAQRTACLSVNRRRTLTLGFDLLYVLVIVRLERRKLVWINVTPHPTAEWIARQVTEAFPWDEAPRYLIRDRDRAYGAAFTHRLRAMGIRDKPIAPGSPWHNGLLDTVNGAGLSRGHEW
jgi:hypothetical protein